MSNPGDFAYTVKQQADIVRVVGDYVKLKKAGAQNFSGLCPFHQEKTPSFSVHSARQFFHCFGCHESGDVFKFVQKVENITFPEAVRLVAQKFGIPLPKATFSSEAEAQEARMRGVLIDVHERACLWFQEQLQRPEGAGAREYLAGRGLDEETTALFRIGYAPDSGFLLKDALRRDFPEEILRASGLFSWKEGTEPAPGTGGAAPAAIYSKFRNRVLFPICNDTGKVIAFTGRTLARDEKAGPKYLNSPETPIYSKSNVLFNLHRAKDAVRKLDYSILVEGQMDCISLYAAGRHNVIASSGTAFTEAQARLLARFSKNIVVNFDPDTAGAAAAERSLALLVEQEFQIKVVTLEQGYDPDLLIRRKGLAAYDAALRGAPKYFDYLIARAQQRFPHSAEGKAQAFSFLKPYYDRIPNRFVQDGLLNEMAQKLGIAPAVLRREVRYAAVTRTAPQMKIAPLTQLTKAERVLLRALATSSEVLSGTPESARDGAEGVFDPAQEAHYILSSERLHEGLGSESLIEVMLQSDSSDLTSLPLSDTDRSLLAGVLMDDEEELTSGLLEAAIVALRQKKSLRLREQELKLQIAAAKRRNDPLEVARLKVKKLELDRALAASR